MPATYLTTKTSCVNPGLRPACELASSSEWIVNGVIKDCFHAEFCDAGQSLSGLCLPVTPKELICPQRKMDELLLKKLPGEADCLCAFLRVCMCVSVCVCVWGSHYHLSGLFPHWYHSPAQLVLPSMDRKVSVWDTHGRVKDLICMNVCVISSADACILLHQFIPNVWKMWLHIQDLKFRSCRMV